MISKWVEAGVPQNSAEIVTDYGKRYGKLLATTSCQAAAQGMGVCLHEQWRVGSSNVPTLVPK